MEEFLIRGWDLIFPEDPWLRQLQSISDQPLGSGFYAVRGDVNQGDCCFHPRLVRVEDTRWDT